VTDSIDTEYHEAEDSYSKAGEYTEPVGNEEFGRVVVVDVGGCVDGGVDLDGDRFESITIK
jgi:hypothetical protein